MSGTSSSIKTKLWWNSHWMVLLQNGVWQLRSPAKMATIVQLRCYWKQLWSRWAIIGSWASGFCSNKTFENLSCFSIVKQLVIFSILMTLVLWHGISLDTGCCEFEHCSLRGVQHYVIKFVSDFATGRWLSLGNPVSSTNKTDCYGITEILLKHHNPNLITKCWSHLWYFY